MSQSSRNSLDICLVVPPFDAIGFPALGTAVLATGLRARGLSVRTVYGSILLASRMGQEVYQKICNTPIKELLGERLFIAHAYPPETLATLGPAVEFRQNRQALFDANVHRIGPFVRTLARQVLRLRPKIVGITSNFQQNMASIALARLIKQRAPEICVVIGGANVTSPMGDELAKLFPWIDHYFSGEADIAFPDFCERYVRDGVTPESKLIDCPPIANMDVVHAPDFADYFASLRHFQKRGRLPASLPEFITMESSRGCWWGEKNHCTFCGLNADGMGFRKKRADRAFEEIRSLTHQWGAHRIHFSDNIMPVNYFSDLLPMLAKWPEHPKLFFEVKANIKDEQLAVMARGGIDMIQPGIESLSSHVLKLMRKGISAPQNVALLRSARSIGIAALWNMLYGFPGERREDYEASLWLMPRIEHLHPPSGLNRVIVDRFSPYHFDYAKFGIASITPVSSYAGIYPAGTELSRIAYHFSGEFTTPMLEDPRLVEAIRAAVAHWREAWKKPPRLNATEIEPGKWAIADTRAIAKEPLVVVTPQAIAALVHFERARPRDSAHGEHAAEIDALLARDFLIEYEGTLMSVVTRRPSAVRNRNPEIAKPSDDARPSRLLADA